MISLPSELPYIRVGSCSLVLCEPEWLSTTLHRAANGTDVPEWIVSDISRGVENFLANHYKGTYIDSEDLFTRIAKTLSSMGLAHIAARIDRTPPPVRISMSELARRAGSGYELLFFQLLSDSIHSAVASGPQRVELHGMKSGIRRLMGARRWSERCELLREELNEYILEIKTEISTENPELRLLIVS